MSDVSSSTPTVRKRAQVKNACVNCQKACKRCDSGRPCQRCTKYNLQSTCVDSKRKPRAKGIKRGPYKKRKRQLDPLTNRPATMVAKGRASVSANISRNNVRHYLAGHSDDEYVDSGDACGFERGGLATTTTGLVTPRSICRTAASGAGDTGRSSVGSSDTGGSPCLLSRGLGETQEFGMDLRLPPIGTFEPTAGIQGLSPRLLTPTKPSVSPLSLLSDVALLGSSSSTHPPLQSSSPSPSPLLPSVRKHIPPLSAARFDCSYRVPPRLPAEFSRPSSSSLADSPLVSQHADGGRGRRMAAATGVLEYAEMESSYSPLPDTAAGCAGCETRAVRRLSQILSRTRINDGGEQEACAMLDGLHSCLRVDDGAGSSSTAHTPVPSRSSPVSVAAAAAVAAKASSESTVRVARHLKNPLI